jgi:hypothetical protein
MNDKRALRKVAELVEGQLLAHGDNFQGRSNLRPIIADSNGWYILLGKRNNIRLELWLDKYARTSKRRFWFGFRTMDILQLRRFIQGLPSDLKTSIPPFKRDHFERTGNKTWQLKHRLPHRFFNIPVEEHYGAGGFFYGIYDPLDNWSEQQLEILAAKACRFFVEVAQSGSHHKNRISESIQKIARISYNSENWYKPTGDAQKYEVGTYNQKFGFGHEDWLFRSEWLIDGWRYAFIQGVNKSRSKLLKEGRSFNLILFTILPEGGRRYVAARALSV